METFAERLKRLREEQGFSVVDLSAAVGVSQGAIRQLESGNVKSPSFALGLRLSKSLHVDPFQLAMGAGQSVTDHLERIDARIDKIERRLAEIPNRR